MSTDDSISEDVSSSVALSHDQISANGGKESEFGSGRNLPFINPSSLETLRALVQEIQSSGETDPEVWKNCEVRGMMS
uniref:Uncharacterized protein n=1 Tax=Electrophorus electricus TaxID=8005 RepID=A0AAY5EBT6_ELEEL